ncbi:helix-turn-helix domain-containing protein [Fervidicoccus fontis]|uniref:Helix-turn-helix domain-containing protein n=1 Tax=Fervidicoccus fontis TaxID=683846 RepID=A0A843ADV3_9CREN|nr:helix-turn-helix domain-containing protein [Fervidicoccus fontis]
MERYYSTRKVCEILGIANRTLRRWIAEGRIRAVNVYGRWRIVWDRLHLYIVFFK